MFEKHRANACNFSMPDAFEERTMYSGFRAHKINKKTVSKDSFTT